jgi:hypothetical protein
MLKELQFILKQPTSLFYDNKRVIYVTESTSFYERTKHLEIDYHYVKKQYATRVVKPLPVHSSAQLADIFTKVFPSAQLINNMYSLHVINLYASSDAHPGLKGVLELPYHALNQMTSQMNLAS